VQQHGDFSLFLSVHLSEFARYRQNVNLFISVEDVLVTFSAGYIVMQVVGDCFY